MSEPMRLLCRFCRHYDDTAYAFENHSASGRICERRDPYEPDLSPFHSHPRFPHVTHDGSCCRAWEPMTVEQSIEAGAQSGRLFL